MPTAQEILVHIERAQAQHFKVAGLLFAGNGAGLLAFTVFKNDLAPPSGAMVVVSGIGLAAAIVFLVSVLIIRKIAKDPPHPAARPLILINMRYVLVGLVAVIATSVVCLVWFVKGW